MMETGHEDRTLLDTLSPRAEDDFFELEEAEPPRASRPMLRIVAQGLIIGHLLPQLAEGDAGENLEIRPGLTRHYFEV
ncbi:hypothetical protein [Rhizobium sp. AG855]|uniref:hypothetical protein n=1 Tax=Rhizobium sp. AG855 TaxID=2183898 RepID=UPI000E757FE2|nr:hypothetical protein [Rhizobium sp. AG855]RKE85467.1 hypothetical protein DFO46_2265 [Rhizobium sp. AG855]